MTLFNRVSVMPEALWKDGKIAAMVEANYIPFTPHNPSGPVANAATLQLAACTANFFYLEIMANDVSWRKDIMDEQLHFEDGFMTIPDKPGLGIDLHEDASMQHHYVPRDIRHYNGTLTHIRPPASVESLKCCVLHARQKYEDAHLSYHGFSYLRKTLSMLEEFFMTGPLYGKNCPIGKLLI